MVSAFGLLLLVEGRAVAPMLGLLEEREETARERVEVLREEAARAAAALETGEIELDRQVKVIGREELVDALAASAAETTATAAEAGEGAHSRRRASPFARATDAEHSAHVD
ncbi:hypothetical protein [Streptomyces sp. NPDC056975]|uniref:hypothetical protein n=1 Tax=unclassified Streptomyces TaxID=2593676 RepID=UPI003627954A